MNEFTYFLVDEDSKAVVAFTAFTRGVNVTVTVGSGDTQSFIGPILTPWREVISLAHWLEAHHKHGRFNPKFYGEDQAVVNDPERDQ